MLQLINKMLSERPSSEKSHRIRSLTSNRTLTTRAMSYRSPKLSLDCAGQTAMAPFREEFGKWISKLGTQPKRVSYIPTQPQQKEYRQTRERELRSQYSIRRRKKLPFEFQVDAIVLNCYNYRQQMGRRSVWRKYRDDIDQLSFQVLRIKDNKRN